MADNIKKADTFKLLIRAREAVIYDGQINYLTSFNDKGKFDVLPEHTNFISLIKDRLIFREITGSEREVPIRHAVLRVLDDEAKVFLGVAE